MMTRVTQAVVFLLALSGFKGVMGQTTQGPIVLAKENNVLKFQDGRGDQPPVDITTITLVKSVNSYGISVDTGEFSTCKIYESNDPDLGECEAFTTGYEDHNDPQGATITFYPSFSTRLCVSDCTDTNLVGVDTTASLTITLQDLPDLDAGETGVIQFYADDTFLTKLAGGDISLPANGNTCVEYQVQNDGDACHGQFFSFNFNCVEGTEFNFMKLVHDNAANCENSQATGEANTDGAHKYDMAGEGVNNCTLYFYKKCPGDDAGAQEDAAPVVLNGKAGTETTAPLKTEHLTNTEVASIAAGGVVGVAVVATVVMYPPVWLIKWF